MLANQVSIRWNLCQHTLDTVECVPVELYLHIPWQQKNDSQDSTKTRRLNAKILLFQIAALTVRYLTRRFIGEYRSKTDLLYRQTIQLDSGLLDVEIVDVSHESDNDFPIEQIQWADACLIVYSITDRESFKYATRSLANMKSLQNNSSAYLIANKSDLDHLREVSALYSFVIPTYTVLDVGLVAPHKQIILIEMGSVSNDYLHA